MGVTNEELAKLVEATGSLPGQESLPCPKYESAGGLTQPPYNQISGVGFETVDFSGCFSDFVSKIETSHLDQSIQVA